MGEGKPQCLKANCRKGHDRTTNTARWTPTIWEICCLRFCRPTGALSGTCQHDRHSARQRSERLGKRNTTRSGTRHCFSAPSRRGVDVVDPLPWVKVSRRQSLRTTAAPTGGRGRAKKEAPAKDFKAVLWASADKLRPNGCR